MFFIDYFYLEVCNLLIVCNFWEVFVWMVCYFRCIYDVDVKVGFLLVIGVGVEIILSFS